MTKLKCWVASSWFVSIRLRSRVVIGAMAGVCWRSRSGCGGAARAKIILIRVRRERLTDLLHRILQVLTLQGIPDFFPDFIQWFQFLADELVNVVPTRVSEYLRDLARLEIED